MVYLRATATSRAPVTPAAAAPPDPRSAAVAPREAVDAVLASPPSIPARLPASSPAAPFDAAYWRRLSALGEAAPERATDATPLRDRDRAFAERLRLVQQARSSILCTTYFIHSDEYGVRFAEELLAAARRGVHVILCLDDFADRCAGGPLGREPYRTQIATALRELERAGGFVSWYAHPYQQEVHFGSSNHFKSLVVDGDRAIIGGRNVGAEYFAPGRWTDFEMRFLGPYASRIGLTALETAMHGSISTRNGDASPERLARFQAYVREMQSELSSALRRERAATGGAPPIGAADAYQLVYADPSLGRIADGGRVPAQNPVTQAMIETIDRAQREITVSTNYLNDDESLIAALERAARRGVRVRCVVTGEAASPGMAAVIYRGMAEGFLPRLHAAGVEIYQTTTQEHGKMLVVDDTVGAFGSYNLEYCSHTHLCEGMSFTRNAETVRVLRAALEDTIAHRAERYDGPPAVSFWQRIANFFLWIFSLIIRPFL
jgi:phosphatidylserine/phosphatidylglycerophosphate/cardiolipin synthase-like enzyme